MDPRIISLYDEYTHAPLKRTEFLRRLALITGSMTAALAILPQIEVNGQNANRTTTEDLHTEYVTWEGVNGEMKGYLARPKEEKQYGTVVVIHENRGLNAHIEDVTRRAAKAGFLALAPNALAPLGGTPTNDDEARSKFQELKADQSLQNFIRAFDYLATRKDSNQKFACVGFCWGGAMANNLAVNVPNLKAAVAFYGRQPATEDVPKIKAAVQLHYASLDTRVNEGIENYIAALKANNITHELYMYEGVNHAFHNDTAPARYNKEAAELAWDRTIKFFKDKLA